MSSFLGPYVHRIDPLLGDAGGVYLWWYGLSYALGFLQIHRWLGCHRRELGLSGADVYTLTFCFSGGVLLGGRLIQVGFDEWSFYSAHPGLIPALWLGGMATHGLLVGAAAGTAAFALACRRPFLELADALVIPGAFLMGIGRIGNFIDGQIVGSVTDVWWAVKFPDAEGFRHPVVLYDGFKNLLLIPYLLHVRRTNPTPGATAARFIFWYAFLRVGVDLFRDYPTHRLALGTGQTLNLAMAALGAVLLYRSRLRRQGRLRPRSVAASGAGTTAVNARPAQRWHRLAFALLLAFCLTIPSNWTQDIPVRYRSRHPGLQYSWLYPPLDSGLPTGSRPSPTGAARPRSP
jgi:phosphatidylglycerol:prolipoprotein diacylglycerol transferase